MEPLLKSEKNILKGLEDYFFEYGAMPRQRELAELIKVPLSTLHDAMRRMEKKGYLKRINRQTIFTKEYLNVLMMEMINR